MFGWMRPISASYSGRLYHLRPPLVCYSQVDYSHLAGATHARDVYFTHLARTTHDDDCGGFGSWRICLCPACLCLRVEQTGVEQVVPLGGTATQAVTRRLSDSNQPYHTSATCCHCWRLRSLYMYANARFPLPPTILTFPSCLLPSLQIAVYAKVVGSCTKTWPSRTTPVESSMARRRVRRVRWTSVARL